MARGLEGRMNKSVVGTLDKKERKTDICLLFEGKKKVRKHFIKDYIDLIVGIRKDKE